MPSRKIEDLLPKLQILFHEFSMRMHDEGEQFIVTCTYRSQEEQDALYAKGRTTQGPIVTWTKHSKHTERKAFDIAMIDDEGHLTWENEKYVRPGEIGKEVGLAWLGPKDACHFQLKES
jgi:peptidoglycan L-alanyl-D-glutamate endopeptidase CwlK